VGAPKSIGLREVAGHTPGFVGTDLANLVNEAALLAVRKDKKEVGLAEFDEAIDRVVAGKETEKRKSIYRSRIRPCDYI
jgi:cell division protease FtsH